jgi:hypothetical protein
MEHGANTEEMAPVSIQSSMDYFHTLLYGMMPVHLVKSVQDVIRKHIPLESRLLFKDDTTGSSFPGFEEWADPILSERLDKAKRLNTGGNISIVKSLRERLTKHKLHPALLSMTLEEEIQEPWFKDMDAADLTVECMLLRSLPASSVNESKVAPSAVPSVKKDMEEQADGRDPLVENVMQTYILLCHLDPYLKVNINFITMQLRLNMIT